MITKHFFKTLLLFTLMIAIGLLGVFLVGRLDEQGKSSEKTSVAK